ncbi:hypothetical protein TNCV_4176971 [Trichonephila clavipes]|nr:hypothetical protein TNCV_4176971 [Trichonephila clavipes]
MWLQKFATSTSQTYLKKLFLVSRNQKPLRGSFAMREKGGNRLMPVPDYMVDASKLFNRAPRVSDESLQTCVAWRCPDGTQHFFRWPILAVPGQ